MPPVYNRDGFMPPITANQCRLLDFAVKNAKDSRVRNDTYEGYGVSNAVLIDATNKISWRMIQSDLDHVPGQAVRDLARRIKATADEVITNLDFKPNVILAQRLTAQAISDWLRTHFSFDDDWAKFHGTPQYMQLPLEERERHYRATGILKMDVAKCVCAGFTNSTVELATALGIKCFNTSGYQRWGSAFKDRWPDKAPHSWAVFEWSDGFRVPADNSIASLPLALARSMNGHIRHPVSLPLQKEDWGVFLCFHYAHHDLNTKLPVEKWDEYALMDVTFDEWKKWDILELYSYRRSLPVSGFGGFRAMT
jgi:hypothetical protein